MRGIDAQVVAGVAILGELITKVTDDAATALQVQDILANHLRRQPTGSEPRLRLEPDLARCHHLVGARRHQPFGRSRHHDQVIQRHQLTDGLHQPGVDRDRDAIAVQQRRGFPVIRVVAGLGHEKGLRLRRRAGPDQAVGVELDLARIAKSRIPSRIGPQVRCVVAGRIESRHHDGNQIGRRLVERDGRRSEV